MNHITETKNGNQGKDVSRRLEGKVSLVTDGSAGIGRVFALAFTREGAKVVVSDVNVTGGQETVQMVKEAGSEACFVRNDVTKAAEVEALINEITKIYGRLNCAFNNAAEESKRALTGEYTEEDWDYVCIFVTFVLNKLWHHPNRPF